MLFFYTYAMLYFPLSTEKKQAKNALWIMNRAYLPGWRCSWRIKWKNNICHLPCPKRSADERLQHWSHNQQNFFVKPDWLKTSIPAMCTQSSCAQMHTYTHRYVLPAKHTNFSLGTTSACELTHGSVDTQPAQVFPSRIVTPGLHPTHMTLEGWTQED